MQKRENKWAGKCSKPWGQPQGRRDTQKPTEKQVGGHTMKYKITKQEREGGIEPLRKSAIWRG